jgi:hypothetical protein
MPAIGADLVLVAERRDRQIDHVGLALARLGLGRLDGPPVVSILVPKCGRLPSPMLGDLPLLGVARVWRGDDARVNQLPGHGEVALGAELAAVLHA